jgi:hypothetical protein
MFFYGLGSLLFWVLLAMGVFALMCGSAWGGRVLRQCQTITQHPASGTRLKPPHEDAFDTERGRAD